MPEIGEVARIVHYLRKHLKNRVISLVEAQDDPIVFGKVGTSGSAVKAALTGKTILDARQQGKYFWLVLSSPPHLLMHFGMTGWIKFSNDDLAPYKPQKEKEKDKQEEWPPKFWKFILKMEGEPKCEAAFIDARRLARVRLVDAPADQMRNTTPLKENGPDPVVDKDILTEQWLANKLKSKKVPVKALLLDQANISGVGNWVGDEVLYNARIHPEQYSNTLSEAQAKQLHKSLDYVCTLACETLADSDQFPEDWLMKHRWTKGKKDNKLPNGNKIEHITVGGRTSAVVPAVQKKTGPVAGDTAEESKTEPKDEEERVDQKPKSEGKSKQSKTNATEVSSKDSVQEKKPIKKRKTTDTDEAVDSKPVSSKKTKSATKNEKIEETNGRRRSGRTNR